MLERHGFERIETGQLVDTYARSKFEDTRRKAQQLGDSPPGMRGSARRRRLVNGFYCVAQPWVTSTSIGKNCGAPPSGGGPPITSAMAGPSLSSMKRSKSSRDSHTS